MNQETKNGTTEKEPGNAPGGEKQPDAEKPKPSHKGLVVAVLVALVLVGLVFLGGYLPRARTESKANATARLEATSLPKVNVAHVQRSASISRLLLPGNITPLIEAPLFARASGYIVKRYVDIGDLVRANQLMAVIEAPDLDQQVAQGGAAVSQAKQQLGQTQAALAQSQAQLQLAKVTWDRYAALVTKGAVAKQDADTQQAGYETAGAVVKANEANVRAAQDNVESAQANLDRLIALQSFKEVRAPFTGVVTARNIDVGTYVSTSGGQSGATTYSQSEGLGNSGGSTTNGALFSVAQISRLRILINVPQSDAANVRPGQAADILVQQYNNRRFPGKVTRTANSLDPSTRTLLTEVQVENPKLELLPGMYADVQFSSPRTDPPILVPGDSLLTRSDGIFIAELRDPDPQKLQAQNARDGGASERHEEPKQIHIQKVEVGRDFGTATEITSGLQGWEVVVTNPSDEVYEGALVLPITATKSPTTAGAAKAGNEAGRKTQ